MKRAIYINRNSDDFNYGRTGFYYATGKLFRFDGTDNQEYILECPRNYVWLEEDGYVNHYSSLTSPKKKTK